MASEEPEFVKKNIFIGKTLRLFLSYSHKDKRIAGAIKEAFNHYGMEAFLAHEDIQVGQEWRNTILNNLKQFDVFVPVISKNFTDSNWTDQEVGFAICQEKIIVPISIDGQMPYGFLEMIQTITKFECWEHKKNQYSSEIILDCKERVFEVIRIFASKTELKENLKDSLIRSLSNIFSYANAEKHFEILNSLQPFSKEQINEIINQSIENNQIYPAMRCRPILMELIENYKSVIDSEKTAELSELISS
ncbi:MAG: TIR domain-containing protein [Candidatus Methanocomedens sp.]|jgi:hypothetical protein|nr:MAG: TIR domain-containing protein [ANME-2 cluster archaeon]